MFTAWHNTPFETPSSHCRPHIMGLSKHLWMCLLLLCHPNLPLHSQNPLTWDDFVSYLQEWLDIPDEGEEENVSPISWTEHLEDLYSLHQHPINVNTATRDEIMSIPFLTERQASDIRDYILRHGSMHTLHELQFIPSIRYFERQVLPLFLRTDSVQEATTRRITLRDMLQKHHHEFLTRLDLPLYHRKGFIKHMSTKQNGYLGSRIYNKIKYDFTATKHIRLNLHAERDAGEQGIDSYGGAFMLSNLGCLGTLIVGDYKVSFGEGLVANQTFSMGRSSALAKVGQGLRINGGTNETGFLRGVGLTLRWGHVSTTAFASQTHHDATLNEDGSVRTILTTGYHRTIAECSKRNLLTLHTIGANINWSHQGWHAGTTGYLQHASRPLQPGTQPYRVIYPHGQQFGVMGIHYGYESYRWLLRGETAYSTEQQGVATLHTLSLMITHDYRLTASQRYYNHHYYSVLSSALSSQKKVQNETGISFRLDASPYSGFQLSTYVDFFYHPWPRFGVPHSSRGMEGVMQILYRVNRRNSISARYSSLNKEYASGRTTHHRLRLAWLANPDNRINWNLTSLLHTLPGSTGMALASSLRGKSILHLPLHAALTALYFHTTDYQSRISLYEPNVSGMVYIPTLSGHGIRLTGTARYTLWHERLHLEMKYGVTRYFDRRTQSSGLQTIFSYVKNDITLQLRLRI